MILLAATLSAGADPLLTVTGHGSVMTDDSEARITVTAEARGATTGEAMAAQRTAVATLTKTMAKAGVTPKDFAVTALNLNPQYAPGPIQAGQPRTISGYLCNTTVTVTVERPDRLGDILQALSDAGVTQSQRVAFVAHASDAKQAEARAAAVKDAFARGQVMAQQTGVTLGRVVSVTDGVAANGIVNYAEQMLAVLGAGGANHTVNAMVTVSWEIK